MTDESVCSVCSRLTGFGDEERFEPPVNLARCPAPGGMECRAWVDPALRDYAREAARLSGLEFSRWVARAVRQTMARESADRAMAAMRERGECETCGYAPCACDQK